MSVLLLAGMGWAALVVAASMRSSQISREEEVRDDRQAWLKAQEGQNP
ncbi:hypothetical protein [Deinococcus sp. QL22]|nr:hypothetical protein [Deinococcus sp. QL22]UQN09227.1 hypothetical protein M1R55_24675 [Deinococcus sp. QL22]